MSRGREVIAGAMLAGIGVCFALAMLEAGVRVLHLVPDRFWEADPELGVRLIPRHSGWWTQEDREFVVPVRISAQGQRDVEHDVAKPAGVFRILVLGDSFVEAMHVPLEAVFTRQLEQALNADGATPRVEVISAGVSGYGTASELLFFRRVGRRYQPDLVLLAFYPGNDVKNNSPTLEDTLRPIYAPDGEIQRVAGEAKAKPPHGWRALVARVQSYHYLRQLLLVRQPQMAQRLIHLGVLRPEAVKQAPIRNGIPLDYGVYAPSPDSQWQEAWRHTEHLFGQLRDEVAASGARLVIVVLSTRDQVYPQSWQQIVAANSAMQGVAWTLDGPQHRVEDWCAANAVNCVALAPSFRLAAARGGERLHFAHDGHWTSAGHHLAAGEITHYLEQHQLVPTRQQGVRDESH